MADFNEYLKFNDNLEYEEKQKKIINKIEISYENREKLNNLEKKIKLEVFAEPYCPDCRVVVAILERFKKYTGLLEIEYFSREKNEERLKCLSIENRIPTIFKVDNSIYSLIMSEYPKFLKDKIKENELLKDEYIYNYRIGKFNEELITELIEKIDFLI